MAIEFKQIEEAPDYFIGNNGQILSKRVEGKTKFMTTHINEKTGYVQCTLAIEEKPGKKRLTFYPHLLVAQYFIPNPNNLPRVNHMDVNKENNHAFNLEWCSQKENIHHYYKSNAKNKPRQMREIEVWSNDGHYIDTYFGMNEAARQTGYTAASVFRQLNKPAVRPRNYVFKYKED